MPSPVSVTRLTASGRGAVAVVRLRCRQPEDAVILDHHFRSASNRTVSTAKIGRILYGHWGAEDVVLVRTTECDWEINCHGGDAAVGRIVADLGGTAQADESISRLERRLLSELLKCRTQRTANYLLTQHQGVLRDFLLEISEQPSAEEARRELAEFLKWERFSLHLSNPWQVAVVGRPNAGKSSLLNAILGYERSIVFDQPGTTRDRIETEVIIDGWPLTLTDTAGLRCETDDEIEAIGVQAAQNSIAESDACLLVTDSSIGWTDDDERLLEQIGDSQPCCILWNKVDLAAATDPPRFESVYVTPTSATAGTGLSEVQKWLSRTLVPQLPKDHQPLPVISEVNDVLRDFIDQGDSMKLRSLRSGLLNRPADSKTD